MNIETNILAYIILFAQILVGVLFVILFAFIFKSKNGDRVEIKRLRESDGQFNAKLLALESELSKAIEQRSLAQDKLNKLSAEKSAKEEEWSRKLKESIDGKEVTRLQEEVQKVNLEVCSKEGELARVIAENLAAKEELTRAKESFIVEKQGLEGLFSREREEFKAGIESLQEKIGKISKDFLAKENELAETVKSKNTLEAELDKISQRLKTLEEKDHIDFVAPIGKKEEKPSQESLAIVHAEQANEREYLKGIGPTHSLPIPGKSAKYLLAPIVEQDKKISEMVLSKGLIEQDILQKALIYQNQYGGTLTQYLLAYGYIEEHQLAECLCEYFRIPYLPLSKYDIPLDIINFIPQDILEKYLVIPVDKVKNVITVVMGDPLDTKAIQEMEENTGYKIRPLVGLYSEIIAALEIYCNVKNKDKKKLPFFINNKSYTGLERRHSVRFNAALDIEFLAEGNYKRTVTNDVSRDGFSFETEVSLNLSSILLVKVYLTQNSSQSPIKAITEVVHVVPLKNNKYKISLSTIKISKKGLNAIIEFASLNKNANS